MLMPTSRACWPLVSVVVPPRSEGEGSNPVNLWPGPHRFRRHIPRSSVEGRPMRGISGLGAALGAAVIGLPGPVAAREQAPPNVILRETVEGMPREIGRA